MQVHWVLTSSFKVIRDTTKGTEEGIIEALIDSTLSVK